MAAQEMTIDEATAQRLDRQADAAFDYARRALPLMAQHGIKPTPKNYAVWYIYVAGGQEALVKEIETLIHQRIAFTADINDYLYHTYIADTNSQIVKQATQGAHRLLSEILQAIGSFSGEAGQYHDHLTQQMQALDDAGDETALRALAQRIIENVASIKRSGGQLQDKLEDSRQEIHQLRANLAKVTTESERDFLTGLYNRKSLDRMLQHAIAQSVEEKHPLCLLMLDIDHFKQFNDQYGHLIGDEVLKIVAKSLTDCVKGMDIVARYGGEEFCVLLPNTPLGGAMIVAENIRRHIAGKSLKRRDTGESYGAITVSIGVAMHRPDSDTHLAFLNRADDALYRAKKSGRNCVTQEMVGKE